MQGVRAERDGCMVYTRVQVCIGLAHRCMCSEEAKPLNMDQRAHLLLVGEGETSKCLLRN